MAIRCGKVKELLDRYYDRELDERKLKVVSEHLRQCRDCSNELAKLEQMGQMLRAHSEMLAGSQDLSRVWERVSATVGEPVPPVPLREKLIRIFSLPRPAWAAVGAVAVVLIVALTYLPFNPKQTFAANDCIIDSVDARDSTVVVYETGDTKMKIIWVMEQNTGEATG